MICAELFDKWHEDLLSIIQNLITVHRIFELMVEKADPAGAAGETTACLLNVIEGTLNETRAIEEKMALAGLHLKKGRQVCGMCK